MSLSAAANFACAAGSTGRCFGCAPAGYLPSQLSPFQLRAGRTGRGMKPPPQFGHTLRSTFSTQSPQKVHSKLQIQASADAGGSARLQCSQLGRSSRIGLLLLSLHDPPGQGSAHDRDRREE